MSEIIDFFNHPFFILVGGASTLLMILVFIYNIYLVLKGILPVWYRLGKGLSQRKIAVFAEKDFNSLNKDIIEHTKLFKKAVQIVKGDISEGKNYTILLVNYYEYKDQLDTILKYKRSTDVLIIYAEPKHGKIDDKMMEKINDHRNTTVVNFRGRLLNDILTSLITTSYDRN